MAGMREKRAKAAGAMKKVGAALKGETGIFRRLRAEHAEMLSLLRQIAHSNNGVDIRRQLFPIIRVELIAHAEAEIAEFYSVLKRFSDTGEMVSRCTDEQKAMEQLLGSLESMDVALASWLDIFAQLTMRYEHHVHDEENRLFPLAKSHLPKADAELLERRYLEEKERHLRALSAEPGARARA
jgi:hypothetical protein